MTDSTKLMNYAIDYLSKYNSSKENLIRILKAKIYRLKIEKKDKFLLYNSIDKLILQLEKNNFLNDKNYASSKLRNFIIQGKSKILIKNYLLQKGISSDILLDVLETYERDNGNWELESARTFARKKRLTNNISQKEKNLSKLARAGFSYDISKKILDEL